MRDSRVQPASSNVSRSWRPIPKLASFPAARTWWWNRICASGVGRIWSAWKPSRNCVNFPKARTRSSSGQRSRSTKSRLVGPARLKFFSNGCACSHRLRCAIAPRWGKSRHCVADRRRCTVVACARRHGAHRRPARSPDGRAGQFLHRLPPHSARTRRTDYRDRNSQAAARVRALLQSRETAHGRHQHRRCRDGHGLGRVGKNLASPVCVWWRRRDSAPRACGRRGCPRPALE